MPDLDLVELNDDIYAAASGILDLKDAYSLLGICDDELREVARHLSRMGKIIASSLDRLDGTAGAAFVAARISFCRIEGSVEPAMIGDVSGPSMHHAALVASDGWLYGLINGLLPEFSEWPTAVVDEDANEPERIRSLCHEPLSEDQMYNVLREGAGLRLPGDWLDSLPDISTYELYVQMRMEMVEALTLYDSLPAYQLTRTASQHLPRMNMRAPKCPKCGKQTRATTSPPGYQHWKCECGNTGKRRRAGATEFTESKSVT